MQILSDSDKFIMNKENKNDNWVDTLWNIFYQVVDIGP